MLAQGSGGFASAAVCGARQRAEELCLTVQGVTLAAWATGGSLTEAVVLIVGGFIEDLAVVEART